MVNRYTQLLQHGKYCLGTNRNPSITATSEDCLFLDVYAPSNATTNSKLPVYLYIQGGGFNDNSNANYNGTGLVTASGNNIIVVTFNYRVGPYGFLTNGDDIPTNNGLYDQRKVMQWVQNYISLFGGVSVRSNLVFHTHTPTHTHPHTHKESCLGLRSSCCCCPEHRNRWVRETST